MGRRRKKRKKQIRKGLKLPSRYFQCPVCGSLTLTIDFRKDKENPMYKIAVARCGSCGLYCEIRVPKNLERIDVYNMISDLALEGRLDECRPTEEPTIEEAPLDQEEAEEGEAGVESATVPPGENE